MWIVEGRESQREERERERERESERERERDVCINSCIHLYSTH